MVFKFLSKGKKSEYFLEAPPSTNGSEPAAKVAEVKQAVEEAVKETVAEVKQVAGAVQDKVASGPAPQKAKKLKKSKADAEAQPGTSSGVSPAAVSVPKAAPQPAAPVKNFATDFLMPSTMPRRRPGPSMDMFRNMAKDVSPRK